VRAGKRAAERARASLEGDIASLSTEERRYLEKLKEPESRAKKSV